MASSTNPSRRFAAWPSPATRRVLSARHALRAWGRSPRSLPPVHETRSADEESSRPRTVAMPWARTTIRPEPDALDLRPVEGSRSPSITGSLIPRLPAVSAGTLAALPPAARTANRGARNTHRAFTTRGAPPVFLPKKPSTTPPRWGASADPSRLTRARTVRSVRAAPRRRCRRPAMAVLPTFPCPG